MKAVGVKAKKNLWMNSHILASIRKRDRLLSQFCKARSNVALYKEFCQIRNAVQRDFKLAKETYFRKGVEQNKGDSGKLWNHLKSLGYSKKICNAPSDIVLEENGVKVFEPICVSRIFNKFYSSVAQTLVSKLPRPSGIYSVTSLLFRQFYSRRLGLRPSFVLTTVLSHFILKQLSSLNPKKAVGLDNVSSFFLREAVDQILLPVTHIMNLSITTETVPEIFKEAKVIPLYKKGSKLDPGNYRPVSILNVLSKILERAVHSQLSKYLEKRGIIFEKQSGFRGGFLTDSCLIQLMDFIKSELASGKYVGTVLIDLQKAFGTVDHDKLVDKLRAVGVDSYGWFASYLKDRRQCVKVNGEKSEFLPITCGVLQGSILGPQLFLLYINDMSISLSCHLSLYADDSALFFAHDDPSVIAERLSNELSNCKKWLVDNKLSLHIGKTESILFGTNCRMKKVSDFPVYCEGTAVGRVFQVKYLGILLDCNLSGSLHVRSVLKSCIG